MATTAPYICARCLRSASRHSASRSITTATTGPSAKSTRAALLSTRLQQQQQQQQQRTYTFTSQAYLASRRHRLRVAESGTWGVATTRTTPSLPASRRIYSAAAAAAPSSPATISATSGAPSAPPPSAPKPAAATAATTAILNPQRGEDGAEWIVAITPRAAHRLRTIMSKEANPKAALRITVESGGCHGFQYLMNLTDTDTVDAEEDTLFVYGDGKDAEGELGLGVPKILMDTASLELLEGSKVDYTMELIGSQFKIVDNPRATSSCGCGTSFDVKI